MRLLAVALRKEPVVLRVGRLLAALPLRLPCGHEPLESYPDTDSE
jgi:hypothetical protein